jgi:hypothetical protein
MKGILNAVNARHIPPAAALCGVVGALAIGGGVGYFLGRRRAEANVEDRVANEVRAVAEHYKARERKRTQSEEFAGQLFHGPKAVGRGGSWAGLVRGTIGTKEEYAARRSGPSPEDIAAVGEVINITDIAGVRDPAAADTAEGEPADIEFKEDDELDEPDLDSGPPVRTPASKPYVITADQFFEEDEELNHRKIEISYWAEDGILADDADEVIRDVNSIVGSNLKQLFKDNEGSHDPAIVYIRNERLESDFSIRKDDRSYLEVVVGVSYGNPDAGRHNSLPAKKAGRTVRQGSR